MRAGLALCSKRRAGVIKNYLIEDHPHRSHLLIMMKFRRKTMINKAKLTLIAAIAASSIALPAAALAQSAYTTGSAASRAAAGYPSPYGNGSGLYDYAQGWNNSRSTWGR
jgi:hypothetical protein